MPARQRVTRTVVLPSQPRRVWAALTAPGGLGWLGQRADVTLRPGAHGTVVDDDGRSLAVQVLAMEPPLLVRWRWAAADGDEPASEVTVRLEPAADGATRVVIEEEALTTPADEPQQMPARKAPQGEGVRA